VQVPNHELGAVGALDSDLLPCSGAIVLEKRPSPSPEKGIGGFGGNSLLYAVNRLIPDCRIRLRNYVGHLPQSGS